MASLKIFIKIVVVPYVVKSYWILYADQGMFTLPGNLVLSLDFSIFFEYSMFCWNTWK